MNKNFLYAAALVFLGITLFDKKKVIYNAIAEKYGSIKKRKFQAVERALKTLPISKKQLEFLMSQVLLETDFFSSNNKVFDLNNNASGIYYTGSEGQLKNGATKGSPRPAKEGGNYAKFNSLNDWAKEYFRVLNRKSMPLDANNIVDFGLRLKNNNYFTDSLETYQKNLNFFYNYLIKNGF